MAEKISLTISPDQAGQRLDQFLQTKFTEHSRSYFNKLIKRGHVLVNQQAVKSGYLLKEEDEISGELIVEQAHLVPQDIPVDIVYQDQHMIVINKPAGLTVHPGKGQPDGTLVNALLHHTKKLGKGADADRPGIVHRLDKFTSGLLVAAKTGKALRNLQSQFQNKRINRIYWALVWGKPDPPSGEIRTFINRSRRDPTKMTVAAEGREAITHYQLLQDFNYCSLLQLHLETGRTHQIRVHLNHIHHPVVGDEDYNGRDSQLRRLPSQLQKRGQHLLKMLPHQALHAKTLKLIHPATGQEMVFESALPENFSTALRKLPQLFLLDSYT